MVALVVGASRGGGRGVALALGDQGAIVYVGARTASDLNRTAAEVTGRGGRGIPIVADFSEPDQVAAAFKKIEREQTILELVVVTACQIDAMAIWSAPFWQLERSAWADSVATISTYWHTATEAAKIMTRQRHGLIVFMTDNHGENGSAYRGQLLHDVGHECLNRFVVGMSEQLKQLGVCVAGVNPGFMRTERVMAVMTNDAIKRQFRFDLSESPEYVGRAIAALAKDPRAVEKSGKLLWGADLAREYGVKDIDGRQRPRFDPKAPAEPFPEV